MTGKILSLIKNPKSVVASNPKLLALEKKLAQDRYEVEGFYRTVIISSLTLAAALFWNNAITSLLNAYFPKDQSVAGQFIAAIVVTLVIAFLILKLKTPMLQEKQELPKK